MYQLQTLRDAVHIKINIYLALKNVNVQLRSLQTVKNVLTYAATLKNNNKKVFLKLKKNKKIVFKVIIDKPYYVAQDYLYYKEAFN